MNLTSTNDRECLHRGQRRRRAEHERAPGRSPSRRSRPGPETARSTCGGTRRASGVTANFVAGMQEETGQRAGNARGAGVCRSVGDQDVVDRVQREHRDTYGGSPAPVLNALRAVLRAPVRRATPPPEARRHRTRRRYRVDDGLRPTPHSGVCDRDVVFPDGMNHMINQDARAWPRAHVSGAVALLLQKFGAMTPTQVIELPDQPLSRRRQHRRRGRTATGAGASATGRRPHRPGRDRQPRRTAGKC